MKKLFLFVLALSGLIAHAQFDIPKKPSFQTSVYDYADVLNPTEEKELENKLILNPYKLIKQLFFYTLYNYLVRYYFV